MWPKTHVLATSFLVSAPSFREDIIRTKVHLSLPASLDLSNFDFSKPTSSSGNVYACVCLWVTESEQTAITNVTKLGQRSWLFMCHTYLTKWKYIADLQSPSQRRLCLLLYLHCPSHVMLTVSSIYRVMWELCNRVVLTRPLTWAPSLPPAPQDNDWLISNRTKHCVSPITSLENTPAMPNQTKPS